MCCGGKKEYLKKYFPVVYEKYQLIRINFQHWKLILFAKKNKKLLKYKGIHKGEDCFIVATGPSLTLEDLELLKGHVCFSVNSIIRVFDKTTWRPDYLCVTDAEAYWTFGEGLRIAQKEVKQAFVGHNCRKYVGADTIAFRSDMRPIAYYETAYYNRTKKISPKYQYYISQDMDRYFCDGPTVVYSVIQLALYMGFHNIYLLGTDCGISGRQAHSKIIEKEKSEEEVIDTSQLGKMLYSYDVLARDLKQKEMDVNIINVTRGGNLESFPREQLECVIDKIG